MEALGTFDELINSDLDFTKLLAAADETQEDEEEVQRSAIQEAKIKLNRKLSTIVNLIYVTLQIYHK